jgi:hypothetical protein
VPAHFGGADRAAAQGSGWSVVDLPRAARAKPAGNARRGVTIDAGDPVADDPDGMVVLPESIGLGQDIRSWMRPSMPRCPPGVGDGEIGCLAGRYPKLREQITCLDQSVKPAGPCRGGSRVARQDAASAGSATVLPPSAAREWSFLLAFGVRLP